MAFSDSGSGFVFGYLVNQKPFNEMSAPNGSITRDVLKDVNDNNSINGVFFFKVLSVIYFFSFCVSMLFYLGAMQWIIGKIGWILQVSCTLVQVGSLNLFIAGQWLWLRW